MDKFFQKIYLLVAIGFSGVISSVVMPNAVAEPSPTKECQIVARDLEARKAYCAHELKSLKSQRRDNRSSGVLCYLVRQVFPINALADLTQCVPKDSGHRVGSGKGKIIPRPKGSRTSLAILQPLGNTLIQPQPDLAWNSIPKAVSYRISLEQGGQWIWSQGTNQTKLKLPSIHTLQPGKSYTLSVAAFGNDDQLLDEEFKLLRLVDTKTLTEIDSAISASVKSSSNPLDRGIDRAMMLYYAGLEDAAVTELRSLSRYQEPAVYLQLGLIYEEAGQKTIAQDYFNKASELANRKAKPLSKNN